LLYKVSDRYEGDTRESAATVPVFVAVTSNAHLLTSKERLLTMKIAQVAPLYESVPPKLYGGTERVVSYLTDELVRQGHDVTLFASGDSITEAKLVACTPRSLRLDEECVDPLAHHMVMLDKVFKVAHCFDIIHFHIDYLHFPLSRRSGTPDVTTLHGRLDIPDLVPLYQQFPQMRVVSISDSQREPLPNANWQGTVYHGLPEDLYKFREGAGSYLAFLGRISPEKRVDRAIEIAKRTGMKLKIAAKVDKADEAYFEEQIEPLLNDPLIESIGEIGEDEKDEFLGNAYALVFPIDWPEPFGLVMTEAMACGTPVIAFPGGSVTEIIEDGVNGFICESIDDAVAAVEQVPTLSRRRCREVFEDRFSATRMAKDYVAIYERISVAAALDQTGSTTLLDLANSTTEWMQAKAPMA
jgi:glycosyltransferase involved in cell wall biosynthesis